MLPRTEEREFSIHNLHATKPLERFINFDIEERYVDDNPDWVRLYGDEVPVGIIGCRKVFKYRVNVDKLTRAIEATPNNKFRNGT